MEYQFGIYKLQNRYLNAIFKTAKRGTQSMKNLAVRDLDSSDYKLWDDLVEASLHGTIFHTTDWLSLFNSPMCSYHQHLYGCFKDDELIGGCSFLSNESKLLNIASTAYNMTPYGGFVLKDVYDNTKIHERESFQKSVIESILNYIESKKLDGVFIANTPEFADVRPFTQENWIANVKYTYYFDLSNNIENTVSKTVKRNVQKALKNGVQIRKESSPQIFYDLLKDTFEKHGLKPPVTFQFLEQTLNMLHATGKGNMWIAQMPSGEVASAEIIVWDSKRAYSWAAASNSYFKSSGSSTLLFYNILQDLKSSNFKEINLMTANLPHLASFSAYFNPKLVPYYSLSKTNKKYNIFKMINSLFR
jgi:hypothetical protein